MADGRKIIGWIRAAKRIFSPGSRLLAVYEVRPETCSGCWFEETITWDDGGTIGVCGSGRRRRNARCRISGRADGHAQRFIALLASRQLPCCRIGNLVPFSASWTGKLDHCEFPFPVRGQQDCRYQRASVRAIITLPLVGVKHVGENGARTISIFVFAKNRRRFDIESTGKSLMDRGGKKGSRFARFRWPGTGTWRTSFCLGNSPKGFEKIALGCRFSGYPGSVGRNRQKTPRGFWKQNATRRNPCRVDGARSAVIPRVAAARQPGATLPKPFGLSPAADRDAKYGIRPPGELAQWARRDFLARVMWAKGPAVRPAQGKLRPGDRN